MPHTPSKLYTALHSANCASEEDVKTIYIKFLRLKPHDYTMGLIDIKLHTVWIEAKFVTVSLKDLFTQSLHYVNEALNQGEHIPSFLMVGDREKAALLPYAAIKEGFEALRGQIGWAASASRVKDVSEADKQRLLELVVTHLVVFYFIDTEEQQRFIQAFNDVKNHKKLVRTAITPQNLSEAFTVWQELVGRRLRLESVDAGEAAELSESEQTLLFFADVMHDGKTSVYGKTLAAHARLLWVDGQWEFQYEVEGDEKTDHRSAIVVEMEPYTMYWNRYDRPPAKEHHDALVARRDSLLPMGERRFDGEFYTPLKMVREAYRQLDEVLGVHWQQDYIVWDMACGTGNLEQLHTHGRNLFLSTLKQREIDIMKLNARHSPHFSALREATMFQYDYLNDDIAEDGTIEYALTGKVPAALREALATGKKVLVLMNPPYAEAGTTLNLDSKAGVAKTAVAGRMMGKEWGKASNELFTQFLARIKNEIPGAIVGLFSKLKYVNAPNFEKFREQWPATFLGGFVFHSQNFDTVTGAYPIGFLCWRLGGDQPITSIECDVLVSKTGKHQDDSPVERAGKKRFFNAPNDAYLNVWIDRPKANPNLQVVPLKNALSTTGLTKNIQTSWNDDAIGYIWAKANDLQNSYRQTVLVSSMWGDAHGFYVTPANLAQAAVVFTVRRVIVHTWLNDRDQFLQPTVPLTSEFETNCLIYMLFSNSNLSAGADGLLYANQQWSLVNHFVPFSPAAFGGMGRLPSYFMVDHLATLTLSPLASAVLEAGLVCWQTYFSVVATLPPALIDELKLGRLDVGWYQIRNVFKKHPPLQNDPAMAHFDQCYAALTAQLAEDVFTFGFLPG